MSCQKLSENEKADVFLDDLDKKRVSDKIRQKNREKKIQCKFTVPSNLSLVKQVYVLPNLVIYFQ